MATASIPVDLFNPGQVFACMGFLEAADLLLGGAEGGFDWGGEGAVSFRLLAGGSANSVEAVLEFLVSAQLEELPPIEEFPGLRPEIKLNKKGESKAPMEYPIRLVSPSGRAVQVNHWADGSSRENFKLYAGNRSAFAIVKELLELLRTRWLADRAALVSDPFALQPVGGTFNFDARKSWTAIDAGYSPNDQNQAVMGSPVVEMLAALGLENSRPTLQRRVAGYGTWSGPLSPILARAALAGISVGRVCRRFRFTLALSGKNKVVTFAQEDQR